VTVAKIIINIIKQLDNGFSKRVITRLTLGTKRWIQYPIHNGIINAIIENPILEYGTGISSTEKIRLPRKIIQNGIITAK